MGPEGVQGAIGKPLGRARRREIFCACKNIREGLQKKRSKIVFHRNAAKRKLWFPALQKFHHVWGPKGSRGRSESPLVAPAGAKFPAFARTQERACKKRSNILFHRNAVKRKLWFPALQKLRQVWGPKRSRGRPESPLVAPAGAKFPAFARTQERACKKTKQNTLPTI